MVGLYKDPKGEEIFSMTAANSVRLTKDSTRNDNEILNLRKRVKELESEVKVKVCGKPNKTSMKCQLKVSRS